MSDARWLGAVLGLALGLGGCRLGDLVTTPQSAPDTPSQLVQRGGDDSATVPAGGVVHDSIVTLSGLVTDPDARDSLRLEVEAQPLGTAFTGDATDTSPAVANGAVATVTLSGLTENGAYRWQARALDATGRASAWTPFDTAQSQPDFVVDAVADLPDAPDSLAQLASDGATVIPVGGATADTLIIFQARLSDPDPGDSLRLQVEREPLGTAFTGTPTATSPAVTQGRTARVVLATGLLNASYHWQVRATDATADTSAWVSFGANAESQADYSVTHPTPPNDPSSLGQYDQGNHAIAPGGTAAQNTVTFKGTVTDPDGDDVRLEVEVQPLDSAFTGTPTASSAFVASGGQQPASVSVTGLPSGDYHWQARAVDIAGTASPHWVPFGNGQTPDFHVQ